MGTFEIIQQRAELYQLIRNYFHHQDVLEVEVPVLGRTSALDPQLASMSLESQGETFYLQTSPEMFMKRLLSQGSGSIFSIGKSFREGEAGHRHNPEFSMLEWYRVGFGLDELIEDVSDLVKSLIPSTTFETKGYADLFQQYLDLNPHQCSESELLNLINRHTSYRGELNRSASLDLLMTEVIEPQIRNKALFIVDYPECQAAMAQLGNDKQGNQVAKRFELYVKGIELANGYLELTDVAEQSTRFVHDAKERDLQGLPQIPEDKNFLKALETGLPDCCGVALGLDRLLWLKQNLNENAAIDASKKMDIGEHILFPWKSL